MSTQTLDRTLPDPATEPTIGCARAAAILGISTRHAHRLCELGELPHVRAGSAVRVLTAEFLAKYRLAPATD